MLANLEMQMPVVLEGFEHIKRYRDTAFNCYAAKILPGEYYVSVHGEMITTVLGSCISACIRDKHTGIGGMNHFMLPEGGEKLAQDGGVSAARYGSFAMELLVNGILKQGGNRRHLECKLFGGGRVLNTLADVGARNIEFVRAYVDDENIPVVAEDLGSTCPRRVAYFPATGKAMMKRLVNQPEQKVINKEVGYKKALTGGAAPSSAVDLF